MTALLMDRRQSLRISLVLKEIIMIDNFIVSDIVMGFGHELLVETD